MTNREELHRSALRTYAEELNVDPELALAVGSQESRFNENAVSPKGARGVMQVMPATAAELAPKYGPDGRRQGVGYLSERLDDPDMSTSFKGIGWEGVDDETKRKFALAGYNAGPGRLQRARKQAKQLGLDPNDFDVVSALLPEETQKYVPGVLGRMTASAPGTQVSAMSGIRNVSVESDDDPEAELMGLANEGAAGIQDDDPESELVALAEGAETDRTQPEVQPRSLGENVYDRTVGRLARATDAALGGLPSTLAGVAGAMSAGDEAGVEAALAEGGGTKERLSRIPGGLLETGLTAAFPGATSAATAAGIGTEAVTGSERAGDVAEIGAAVGPGVARLARAGVRGGRALLGGKTAAEEVTAGLGAERTAQEVGRGLQAPRGGAKEAITSTSREASAAYKAAGQEARAAGSTVGAKELSRAARRTLKDARAAGAPLTGSARRVVTDIVKAVRGKASNVVGPSGKPVRSAGSPMNVDDLIEAQSKLRRELAKLPYNHGGRRPMIELSKQIDDLMESATQGTTVGSKLGEARRIYREKTIPTRKTADRINRAETPEQATRTVIQGRTPSRFERMEAGAPRSAEPLRSAFFNDLVQSATENGQLNLRKLATNLSKAEGSGQLKNMANTAARKNTVRAIQKAAKFQRAAKKAPVVGAAGGVSTGFLGLGAGYVAGRVLETALTSERASRALLRLAQARQGTPGWRLAAKKLKDILGPSAGAATARGIGASREKNDGE